MNTSHGHPLSVADLSFRYGKDGAELFGGLTHTFTSGAITAVTGASGRGKSTLLYVLGLLLRPSAGHVRLGGRSLSDLPDGSRSAIRASTVGFVFQDASLDPRRSVLDNVCEPAVYAGLDMTDTRDRARALVERLAPGIDTRRRPGQISGGQAQRIAIARALINGPTVVLADEPTGNLDAENTASVLHLLRDAAERGTTVVVATHDPSVSDFADEILTLQ